MALIPKYDKTVENSFEVYFEVYRERLATQCASS